MLGIFRGMRGLCRALRSLKEGAMLVRCCSNSIYGPLGIKMMYLRIIV